MKLIIKLHVVLVLVISFLVSCEQQGEVVPINEKEELTNSVLSSDEFKNLQIPLASLNVANSQFTTSRKKSVVIPFAEQEDKKGVLALFNDDYKLQYVVIVETQTSIESSLIPVQIENGKFIGEFIFTTETGSLELSIKNSQIINSHTTIYKGNNYKKEPKCNDITKKGGAYDCAGARIKNRNWFDKASCYISFGYCFAEEVISCAIDGCEV